MADRLHSAAIHLLRRLRKADDKAGLGASRLSILSVLVFAGDKTLGELARMEQVKPPTMTKLIQSLIAEGFVKRVAKTSDRRKTLVKATAKGHTRLIKARQSRILNLAQSMSSLGKDEIDTLLKASLLMERLSEPD